MSPRLCGRTLEGVPYCLEDSAQWDNRTGSWRDGFLWWLGHQSGFCFHWSGLPLQIRRELRGELTA